jgi:hypothetical protein
MEADFPAQGGQVILRPILTIDLKIKGAEMAATPAEGNVNVEAERHKLLINDDSGAMGAG